MEERHLPAPPEALWGGVGRVDSKVEKEMTFSLVFGCYVTLWPGATQVGVGATSGLRPT